MSSRNHDAPEPSRRDFVRSSTIAATGVIAQTVHHSPLVHAAGSDMLKVGLIGCGGRGTGAASQALKADSNVKLTAMGDVFGDRLQQSLKSLSRMEELTSKIDVPVERQFVGFDAYQRVLESGVDVVLLATPPHFRPIHLQAAVAAGKHVFAEKPCAVDAPGVHSVLRSCEQAKTKNLSIVSGLCLRYHEPYREAISRIRMGRLEKFVHCSPMITADLFGSSRVSLTGAICFGKCRIGTTSPGFQAISTSSSMFTILICAALGDG